VSVDDALPLLEARLPALSSPPAPGAGRHGFRSLTGLLSSDRATLEGRRSTHTRLMPGTTGPAVEQSADFLRTRNRLLASLLVLGGLGALAVAASSADPETRGPVPIGIAVGACALGALLFTQTHRFPTAAVLPLALLGQLSSTALAWSAGSFEVSTGTLGYSYVWTCAFVAYFLTWRQAVLNLVVTLSLYGLWLSLSTPGAVARPRWIAVAAVLIALTLVIGKLRDEVQRLVGALAREARHDPLTGLLNRRGFMEGRPGRADPRRALDRAAGGARGRRGPLQGAQRRVRPRRG
jgi:hypothetical protein